MKTTDKNRRSERGTQLLELALVLPLLLFMAMLVSEGADFIRVHQVLNNAAREGAKFSTLPVNNCNLAPTPADCVTAIRNVVVQYASNNNVTIANPGTNVVVDQAATRVVPSGAVAGFYTSRVTVTFSYPIVYLKIAPGFTIPNSITLVGSSEFRNFYGPGSN
jgi:Flp pilus assembly protein TadG